MAVITATNDSYCKYDVAMEHLDQINSQKTLIDVQGEDHDYFNSAKVNNDWFMQQLVEQLHVPTSSANFTQ